MLQWLIEILESGEHALTVVGVNGTTERVLAHTFIEALIEKMTADAPVQAPAPQTNLDKQVEIHTQSNPVPTSEQIAAYLAQQAASPASVTQSTVIDAATGAPQGTFQATA